MEEKRKVKKFNYMAGRMFRRKMVEKKISLKQKNVKQKAGKKYKNEMKEIVNVCMCVTALKYVF